MLTHPLLAIAALKRRTFLNAAALAAIAPCLASDASPEQTVVQIHWQNPRNPDDTFFIAQAGVVGDDDFWQWAKALVERIRNGEFDYVRPEEWEPDGDVPTLYFCLEGDKHFKYFRVVGNA